MYKLLLCWRYLLTRYLALACIISVMLGVATLIVVNSVMGGFSTKLKDRLHGLLSDVLVEATTYDGFADPDEKMKRVKDSEIGQYVEAMTPTVEIFAMIQFRVRGETVTRPVHLIGVDPVGRASIGGFAEHLTNPENRENPSFRLPKAAEWRYLQNHPPAALMQPSNRPLEPGEIPPPDPVPSQPKMPRGIIVGNAIASFRDRHPEPGQRAQDIYILQPGDDVVITTVSGQKLAPVVDRFVVCDYFKSEMSEYDANYVFVPLDYLQHLRTMDNRATSIQIKLKDYRHSKEVVTYLQKHVFPPGSYMVQTWESKQGSLLAAISIERGILNLLLFLIIGVAGFGILAIFSMIVVEKTRDIGILKSLGASNKGVMTIFLGYGMLLGCIGAGLGTALGLTITTYINEIERFLANLTGQDIFDRTVYYFDKIPTDIQPTSVLLVNAGALAIAVLASVLPALRAALLHPVRALRYE
ncbi:MAG: FtsX-like permease family protein [Gemmataceae bacterium]|nr:FtsX-like permease family protein [Gemmataceae bacterium]